METQLLWVLPQSLRISDVSQIVSQATFCRQTTTTVVHEPFRQCDARPPINNVTVFSWRSTFNWADRKLHSALPPYWYVSCIIYTKKAPLGWSGWLQAAVFRLGVLDLLYAGSQQLVLQQSRVRQAVGFRWRKTREEIRPGCQSNEVQTLSPLWYFWTFPAVEDQIEFSTGFSGPFRPSAWDKVRQLC